jgi:hypothetical protein
VAVVTVALGCWAALGTAAGQQAGQAGTPLPALRGAIDIHVHSYPDDRPRSIDAIEVATLARARGMRAIVLKNHDMPTAGTAYLVRTQVPGIEVFGGIALNLAVGGINAAAVEHMTRVSGGWGRIVWMPTYDAENHIRYSKEDRPFVSVARDGVLLPDVKTVIGLIARHGLVLATGHSSPEEALLLLREGRRQGVQQMVVTHATFQPVLMNTAHMQEAASLGAFLEFAGGSVQGAGAADRMKTIAAAIRAVGPASSILSTDLGQRGNPLPPDGFAAFLDALRAEGFSDADLDLMSKQNPARLLGLP